jgi:hypothetical protein
LELGVQLGQHVRWQGLHGYDLLFNGNLERGKCKERFDKISIYMQPLPYQSFIRVYFQINL